MLRGIDPILGPDLLHALRAMGHGDDIVIADANYPAMTNAKRLIRVDGVDAVQMADAILKLMPLDSFVDFAAYRMEVVDNPKELPPIAREFQKVIRRHEPGFRLGSLERFAFYERCKSAFAVVVTGERRFYGNLILKKGVISPGKR